MADEHNETEDMAGVEDGAGVEETAAAEEQAAEDTAVAEGEAAAEETVAAEEPAAAEETAVAEEPAEAEVTADAGEPAAVEEPAAEDAAAAEAAPAAEEPAANDEPTSDEPASDEPGGEDDKAAEAKAATTHTYDELKLMTVVQMREIAEGMGEHEALHGYTTMHKEEMLVALCKAQGLDAHEHHEVVGIDKGAVKAKIRDLKQQRDALVEAKDAKQLKIVRRRIRSLKRKIHKATV